MIGFRRPQERSVRFCASIVGSKIIGPWIVDNGVKINAGIYCKFFDQMFWVFLKTFFE